MRAFFPLLFIALTAPSLCADQENSSATLPPQQFAVPPSPSIKASITVAIAIIATIFLLTFLILLFLRLYRQELSSLNTTNALAASPIFERKNFGIDRRVIESLPTFRFGSMRGHEDGMDCAVCLTMFEPSELLRILPKCQHAFHVDCVDKWLYSHSTCPICRYRVQPEDIFSMGRQDHEEDMESQGEEHQEDMESQHEEHEEEEDMMFMDSRSPRLISRRHSSAGEQGIVSEFAEGLILQNRHSVDAIISLERNNFIRREDGLLLMDHRINMAWGDHGEYDELSSVEAQERRSDVHVSAFMYARPHMQYH